MYVNFFLLEYMNQDENITKLMSSTSLDGISETRYKNDYNSVYNLVTHSSHMTPADLFMYALVSEALHVSFLSMSTLTAVHVAHMSCSLCQSHHCHR